MHPLLTRPENFTIPGLPLPGAQQQLVDMVYVPGDTFRMGSPEGAPGAYGDESPDHDVTVSSFFIGRFPVTQALWKAVMKDDNPSFFKGDERPVEQVSWDRITNKFLPVLEYLTGISFRLPTEAEWEYAARGGPHHKDGLLYAGSNKLKEVGWFRDNSHLETKPVGLNWPNPLGLYDMSGNVWEWCQDWYSEEYYKECYEKGLVNDPPGPNKYFGRVIRGGCCWNEARSCRAAYRSGYPPEDDNRHFGFRLAASFQGGG